MPIPRKPVLSPLQKLFCYHYVELGGEDHGSEAAIAAGYAQIGSYVRACRLLKRPDILAEIQKQTEAKERRNRKLSEAVAFNALDELAEMAKSWRESKYGLQSSHVRAAELYLHNSGESPEAKKIMAEIKSRAAGLPTPENEIYHAAWTQNKPN